MRAPNHRPNSVSDVLSDVLKRVDPEHQLPAYAIWTFWNAEVGDVIARRAQPARFRNGVLFVTVATHSWMQELQFMKEDIRARLNTRLGAELVRDIYFVSGTVESEGPPAAEDTAPTPRGRALVALPEIADPELAAAFTRLIEARAKRLARPPHGRTKQSR